MLDDLAEPPAVDDIAELLAYHGGQGGGAFCRHGGDDISTTISGAIYLTRERRMLAALGNPCTQPWQRFDLRPDASAAAAQ
jgi:hypothetical protein